VMCGADAEIQTGGEQAREHPASLAMVETRSKQYPDAGKEVMSLRT